MMQSIAALTLIGSDSDQARTTGITIGQGANVTRELGNLPGNTCTRYLADQAVQLAEQFSKLSCEVFDEDALRRSECIACCLCHMVAMSRTLHCFELPRSERRRRQTKSFGG